MKQIGFANINDILYFMNKKYISATLTALVLVSGGWYIFNSNTKDMIPKPESQTASITNEKIMNTTFKTNKGDIVIEFNKEGTPNTVANFTKLAQANFYNGVKFHRVIKNFMIQGGDPLTKDDSQMARWGTGGPGYTFADEIGVNNKNLAGTISMANAGANTNGSQFFINTKDNNGLDSKHTVFGRVVVGMDVVMKIENSKTDSYDRPIDPVIIESVVLK